MPPSALARVRKLALSLPEAHEVIAWGEPTVRVRNKLFAMFASAANHPGGGRNALWCKAASGIQQLMLANQPDRFFTPPYVGPSGWVGVYLDTNTDWVGLRELLTDGYRSVAPKKLAALVASDRQ